MILRHPPVRHLQVPFLSGLALEREAQPRALDHDMPVAQRRQSEALVVARIGGVADADHRVVEQPDDRGYDALARQLALAQVPVKPLADGGQRARELGQAEILHLVAARRPALMVAVLLAAALVAPGRLQVAVGVSADPDVRPGRRNRQHADAVERCGIAHRAAVDLLVAEALAAPPTPDARFGVADIGQGRLPGIFGSLRYAATAAGGRAACHDPHVA